MTKGLINATTDMNEQMNELMAYVIKNVPMETYRDMDPMVLTLLQSSLKLVNNFQKVCYEQAMAISRLDDKINKVTEAIERLNK